LNVEKTETTCWGLANTWFGKKDRQADKLVILRVVFLVHFTFDHVIAHHYMDDDHDGDNIGQVSP